MQVLLWAREAGTGLCQRLHVLGLLRGGDASWPCLSELGTQSAHRVLPTRDRG